MVRQSGWGGLYKGNLVSVLHSAPQKALSFFAFDAFKARLRLPLCDGNTYRPPVRLPVPDVLAGFCCTSSARAGAGTLSRPAGFSNGSFFVQLQEHLCMCDRAC